MTHFSPKQVAKALGVSESSVKRWCDLGAVPMLRTAGGHRRIPRKSLEELLAQGGDLSSTLEDLASNETQALDASVERADQCASLPRIQDEFRQSLKDGQEKRCRELIHELLADGWSRWRAADCLITDAMHQFGHMWQEGDMAIYQERRACGVCLGLIHELKQTVITHTNAPVAMGGAPQGDVYQLPTQLVELALLEAGWRATSLGCNLPMNSMVEAFKEYQPRLVWVSLSAVECEKSLVADFNSLANALPPEVALIVGGRAANDSLRPKLRYTAHCDSLEHLTVLAAAFLAKLR